MSEGGPGGGEGSVRGEKRGYEGRRERNISGEGERELPLKHTYT